MDAIGTNFRVAEARKWSPSNEMISLSDYVGREQSYVKHVFLESYLERLVHKIASTYQHIVYVDGFAGPWQSANEKFEDTSFGIALKALSRAKNSWQRMGRDVAMSAFLVERDPDAYGRLMSIPPRFPDVSIATFNADFLVVIERILSSMQRPSFAFFLIDPKGWRIRLRALEPLLSRRNSEVVFNFMFDFINRAASIKDPVIAAGLDELIPFGDWRAKLAAAERLGSSTPEQRKSILVEAFSQSLSTLGTYEYVAETTVLRPIRDRPLYCLFHATRHPKGIEVFRECQLTALKEESKTRAAVKVKRATIATGQGEFFESLHDMAPDELDSFLQRQRADAEETLLSVTPFSPDFVIYEKLRARVMARHVVSVPDVNKLATRLYKQERLLLPDWERGKRVPQARYRVQRAF